MSNASEKHNRLSGRVALVTGAGSGIGLAVSRLFAGEGARVALADVDVPSIEAAANEIGNLPAEALAIPLDVSSEDAWQSAMANVVDAWGGMHILVNSAGIADDAPLTELRYEQWRRVLSVNLDGTFFGTAAAIRAMQPAGTGSIINVASLSGIKASAGAAAYCCSKAAVIQLSRVAALECAAAGTTIRVNCVVPGGVRTPMWQHTPMWPEISTTPEWQAPPSAPPLKRFADPEEIARAILFLASEESSYISGSALVIDGGASA